MTYFLYARKSTDVEDKQVRSIEDQLAVLRALAKQEGLHIVQEFIEKQSAKIPGRPVFNEMLSRIERGEARGIVCWKLDRLARNPVDGGQISWFLQQGTIQHIRTYERDYYSADNMLLMSVEFGMANQFILDLAANTKRGLDEKVKRGEYPSLAPIGYLNDRANKTIVVHKASAKVVKAAFELYAEGNSRLEDIANFFAKHGFVAECGKPMTRQRVIYILSNPFYYGLFRYNKELHEGKHQPIISKKLFDDAQAVMKRRGWQERKELGVRPLCGLIKCGECGASITAETKIKKHKNGNVHTYTYYRCTKKTGVCSQPFIREELLNVQLAEAIKSYALPEAWAADLNKRADKDEAEAVRSSATASQAMREEVATIGDKLQRLHRLYLDEDIERDVYRTEKADLLSRKKSLEEKMADLNKGTVAWLGLMREWIKDAENLRETVVSPSLPPKKSSAQKIFGSNLFLNNRLLVSTPTKPYASLREAGKNFGENELCLKLEHVWDINADPFTNTVDVHIRFLRTKIDEGHKKKLLKTVHGYGYKIEA